MEAPTKARVVRGVLRDRGGVKNPWLSTDMKPLGLSAQEQSDLVEFMKALTGRIDPEVSRPPVLPKSVSDRKI
jgi:hypothetical protein